MSSIAAGASAIVNDVDEAAGEALEAGPNPSFAIVAVGASAGGLEAFTALLKALPADTGMAFVLVQHLAPSHTSALAEILSRVTRMPVTEALEAVEVAPNHVYVIPPGQSMTIAGGALQLLDREETGQHRVIDHFFRTLADDARHLAIGVVLSGTATDGTLGLEAIKAEGGITFAQDDSAQQPGMPHSAIASGCVDFVLPPDQIAAELARIAAHPYTVPRAAAEGADDAAAAADLGGIVQYLHRATGVNFSGYKFNTFYRRVARRMVLAKIAATDDYLELLRQTPAEVEALYQDVLIGVTSFFRNPDAFEAIKRTIFPRLLAACVKSDAVRVWALGCSTGQEAYSLAMAFAEFAEAQPPGGSRRGHARLQLFATDLNAANIDKARAGVYPKTIEQDVSPERLRRFFTEIDGGYRIAKTIRDACVFSRHNVLTDPPFSRMDLISCRNLLIYLEPRLQKRVLPTLHYALNAEGCLWLGASETIGGHRKLFDSEDPRHKLYAKKPGASPGHLPTRGEFVPPAAAPLPFTSGRSNAMPGTVPEVIKEADRLLLGRYAPPAVVVSPELEILQYRGDVGAYLTPMAGKPSLNLLKMLREGLLVAVRAATLRAGKERVAVREEGLRIKASDGATLEVAIEVVPLSDGDRQAQGGAGFIILFEPAGSAAKPQAAAPIAAAEPAGAGERSVALEREVARLTQELAATREYLQALIEQQEAANEELQSANEEVQSANEELQSTNEELETSKEEIQSSNEELVTLNDELNNRSAELTRTDNDHVNVVASANMPMIIVGADFRIRSFTPAAERMFGLIGADIGRPLRDIRLQLNPQLAVEFLLKDVIDAVTPREVEATDAHGRWWSLRLRPYRTLDNRIDGAVLVLVDIDAAKRPQEYTDSILATANRPLLVLDQDLRVRSANRAFIETFDIDIDSNAVEGRLLYELGSGQLNIPELRRLLEELLPQNHQIDNFEVRQDFGVRGRRTVTINARRLLQASGRRPAIFLSMDDITEREQNIAALRDSEARFRMLADNMSQFAWMADTEGRVFWSNARWLDYTGTPLEAMQGPVWKIVQHPDFYEAVSAKFQQHIRDGLDWEDTFPLRGRGGAYRWFLSRAMPIRDDNGAIVRWLGTNTDVTEQRDAEDSLKEADLHKNEFLAMLAHELRNPLAPIQNALQIMRLKHDGGESFAAASSMMERQVVQIVRLVDDLMDMSRISRGKIELRPSRVELSSIVYQAVEAARPPIEAMRHKLVLNLPPQPLYLNADPVRLAQVIGNLLNNACKFTDRGGRISLDVQVDNGDAVLRVRDNGIGIAANKLPDIFGMFVQIGGAGVRTVGGLGIGLTLARNLVEMHGGSIEAHSEGLSHGSEFVVRLPILMDAAQVSLPASAETLPSPLSGRRILIVDDNRDAADSLAQLLEMGGNITQTAYDGPEALIAAESFRPELVVLDLGLPTLNGYQVARQLRVQAWGQGLVLVALTGWGQAEARQKTADAGFDGHLVKPVEESALAAVFAQIESRRNS